MTDPTYGTVGDAQHMSDDGPMCTVGFPFGFLLGLPIGIVLWLPETLLIANIMVGLLHLPGNMSAGTDFLCSFALYVVWLLLVLAPLPILLARKLMGRLNPEEKRPRFGFFRGLLCALPLATLYINYIWQTSGTH
jgi:hypothetical protein